MKRVFSVLCTILLGVCATMAFAADVFNWKLASGYSDASFHTQNLREFAQEVDSLTQGRLKIAVHSNNSLVKLADLRAAVESGTVEAGEVILTGISKEFPMAGADSLPFVVSGYADAQRLWALQRSLLDKELGVRGLIALYSVPWPAQGLYTARPIIRKSDFLGNRMRTYNSTTVAIAEMLGASAVDVPMVQVSQALADGRMDSMISSAVTGVENRTWTHLKYFYEINAWTPKNAVLANAQAVAVLPVELQQALLIAANNAERRGWTLSREASISALAILKLNGVRIERIPSGLEREFSRLGERFSKAWIKSAGASAGELFTAYFLKLEPSATITPVVATKP
jgi:TRAP-type transport system periplasmic protein